ncbi:MAG: hypothetical protein IAE79_00980 [Anaerolinea sp.]|nr:hypothetical protein [Anaerolinea sp.]
MKTNHVRTQRFVVCLNNEGYEASLEVGKLYRLVPDEKAAMHGYMRVIDESGEDYAYTTDRFLLLDLSPRNEESLLAVL